MRCVGWGTTLGESDTHIRLRKGFVMGSNSYASASGLSTRLSLWREGRVDVCTRLLCEGKSCWGMAVSQQWMRGLRGSQCDRT